MADQLQSALESCSWKLGNIAIRVYWQITAPTAVSIKTATLSIWLIAHCSSILEGCYKDMEERTFHRFSSWLFAAQTLFRPKALYVLRSLRPTLPVLLSWLHGSLMMTLNSLRILSRQLGRHLFMQPRTTIQTCQQMQWMHQAGCAYIYIFDHTSTSPPIVLMISHTLRLKVPTTHGKQI